ncbi:MAG: hypothetical protein ABI037_09465 [Gemmatimonadales bacterium]
MTLLLHERWFVADGQFPVQFGLALTRQTWIPLGVAIGVTVLATALWRARRGRPVIPGPLELGMPWQNYQQMLSWMPLVIGVHTAVPLLVSGVNLRLLVPNLVLPTNLLGGVLGLAEIVVGLSFVYGALARFGAATLALVWLAGALLFGPIRLLEHSLFLGIAFFIFAMGRGPLAFDMALTRLHRPVDRLVPYAVPVLRVLTGVSILVLAFTEKLWNPDMGLAFLKEHPFNFFPALGLQSIDDRAFLLIAGTVELTFGALLISGAFIRLVILLLWVPFNLTLPFLGWRELVGHLPIYGILALLLIWGETRPQTEQAMIDGIGKRDRPGGQH